MRCLVVEDYVELAELWCDELNDLGFQAVAAHSAEEAFHQMLVGRFDLVIADLGLPDGSGLTVAQSAAIRAPGADVIVVTGQVDFPHGELFEMSSNIAAVFRKTTDLNDMLAFAEHLREKHERHPEPDLLDASEEDPLEGCAARPDLDPVRPAEADAAAAAPESPQSMLSLGARLRRQAIG